MPGPKWSPPATRQPYSFEQRLVDLALERLAPPNRPAVILEKRGTAACCLSSLLPPHQFDHAYVGQSSRTRRALGLG